jgi:aldehyde:ferredoxin oxidoreductase
LNGPAKGRYLTPENFEYMLDDYYNIRGWNRDGVPTEETLAKYDINEELLWD